MQWLYEFGKIGNNVNRLAKYCYTLREEADTEQVTMYLYALTAVDQLQAEIRRAL